MFPGAVFNDVIIRQRAVAVELDAAMLASDNDLVDVTEPLATRRISQGRRPEAVPRRQRGTPGRSGLLLGNILPSGGHESNFSPWPRTTNPIPHELAI